METDTQQARRALQAIAEAESAARRHGPNNGTVPLVWGVVVLACLIVYDLIPTLLAPAVNVAAALAASAWTVLYVRRLPVKPLKLEKPWLFGVWGLYHGAVLMGGMALGTHFWHADHALPGTFTLIGLLDAAPLLFVGWRQRRRARGEGNGEEARP